MMQSRRIDPLLRRAQEKEDAVARDLAERQRTLAMHESRLEELRRYADEYAGQHADQHGHADQHRDRDRHPDGHPGLRNHKLSEHRCRPDPDRRLWHRLL